MPWDGFDGDFVQRRYEHELDRRDKLSAAIQPAIVVMSALGAAEIGMFRSWRVGGSGPEVLAPLIFCLLAFGVAAVFCVVHLARSYVDQKAEVVSKLLDLASHRQEKMAAASSEEASKIQAELFNAQLLKRLAEATDVNATRNDQRSEELFQLRQSLVWLLAATALTAIFYAINQLPSEWAR